MGWYHFKIDNLDSYNEAFELFLNDCIINEDRINNDLDNDKFYRFIIRTDGDFDNIYCSDGNIFLKSKFLKNKLFKRKLIDYYRMFNVYVTGPTEIFKKDGSCMNKWLIELCRIKTPNSF